MPLLTSITAGDLSKLKSETIVIKEGIRYRMKVVFRVR